MAEMFSNEPNKKVFEPKFTKDEWIINPKFKMQVTDNYRNVIATVPMSGNTEQDTSDVQLISAAPDMFNALKDLYDDREVWSDLFESQQEFICRVLNKATVSDFFKH